MQCALLQTWTAGATSWHAAISTEHHAALPCVACSACPWTIQAVHLFREQGNSTWEADVRFWNAQDAARVLRFKLGLKVGLKVGLGARRGC